MSKQAQTIDLLELHAWSEEEIQGGRGELCLETLQRLAAKSPDDGLRFLCAWIAFKLEKFHLCLNICAGIKAEFDFVTTLQALAIHSGGAIGQSN